MHYATSNSEQLDRLTKELERLRRAPHQVGVLDGLLREEDGESIAVVSTHEGLLEVPVSESVSQEDLVPGRLVALDFEAGATAFAGLPAWSFELILPLAFGVIAFRSAIQFAASIRELRSREPGP